MATKRFFNPTVKASTGGPAYFHGWKEWNEGNYIIGEFISSYETTYRGQVSTNYRVKVLECDFTVNHKEEGEVDPTGAVLVLNSAGQLNKFMEDVKQGMLVEVVYGGKKPGKDGTLYHKFERLEAGYPEKAQEEVSASNAL
jgi:hypothetical protein